ncbi:MAG: hypothetical protein IV089_12660 [Thiobacillus sp.]|nr:hypothetical protein [Thiobacillus sp.]
MTLQSGLLAGLLLTLSACALPPEWPAPHARQAEPAASVLIGELARVSALSAEQRRRELAELEGARLDDARRFQLAALLERDDSVEALERSLKNLTAIGDQDSRSQSLIELMKKSLKARIEIKQLAARNTELQNKLDQIKALEKSLQQRNSPFKTP